MGNGWWVWWWLLACSQGDLERKEDGAGVCGRRRVDERQETTGERSEGTCKLQLSGTKWYEWLLVSPANPPAAPG